MFAVGLPVIWGSGASNENLFVKLRSILKPWFELARIISRGCWWIPPCFKSWPVPSGLAFFNFLLQYAQLLAILEYRDNLPAIEFTRNFDVVSFEIIINLLFVERWNWLTLLCLVKCEYLTVRELSLVRLWLLLLFDNLCNFVFHIGCRYALAADVTQFLSSRLFRSSAHDYAVGFNERTFIVYLLYSFRSWRLWTSFRRVDAFK